MKELELFYNNLRTKKVSPEITIKNYDCQIKEFFNILNIEKIEDIKNIKMTDIDIYKSNLISKGNKLSSVRTKLCAIRSFFEFLLERDYIQKNIITKNVYPIVPRTKKRIPDTENFQNIVENSKYNIKYYVLTLLFITTGMRFSELSHLKLDDFQNDILIVNGKGGKQREIILQDNIAELLKDYIDNHRKKIIPLTEKEFNEKIKLNILKYKQLGNYQNYINKMKECKDLIFQSQIGLNIKNSNFNCHIKKIAQKSGVDMKNKDISAHVLRHFYAIFNLDNGVPLDVLQENMGHQNINTTRIYAETRLERRRKENKKAYWSLNKEAV